MIPAGGISFNKGIKFVSARYSVLFMADQIGAAKFYLYENHPGRKPDKSRDFLGKVPLLRNCKTIFRNSKPFLLMLALDLLGEITRLPQEKEGQRARTSKGRLVLSRSLTGLSWAATAAAFCFLYRYILSDLRSVWQYHGAEHKVIYANNQGGPVNLESAKKASRVAERCGTQLVVLSLFANLLLRPFVKGQGLRFVTSMTLALEIFNNQRLQKRRPFSWLVKLGYACQEYLFTAEPEEEKLSHAVTAFNLLADAETGKLSGQELTEKLSLRKDLPLPAKFF